MMTIAADPVPAAVAIIACNDLDVAEAWWNRLGFTRPADQGHDDYRMLSDPHGGQVHLNRAVEGWLRPDRNPFGIYLYRPDVDVVATGVAGEIIEPDGPSDKPWGMYEFALNGPDGLLVRIGWPTRLRPPRG